MTKILIIDTETDGLFGAPDNVVLEVGVTELDTVTGDMQIIHSATLHYDKVDVDAWVFHNSDLRPEDIIGSDIAVQDEVQVLRDLVSGRIVTAYNTYFDFDTFLHKAPWNLNEVHAGIPLDIMDAATDTVYRMLDDGQITDSKTASWLTEKWSRHPGQWLRAIDAYTILCPADPVGLHGIERHRADADSLTESYILRAILERRTDLSRHLRTFEEKQTATGHGSKAADRVIQ